MTDNLIPVKVIDKNNKLTTVHKRQDEIPKPSRDVTNNAVPPTFSDKDRAELLVEVNAEYERVNNEIAEIDEQRNALTKLIVPLHDERSSLLDMKMELEADKVDINSPIEEIKALNKLAFYHHGAANNERNWMKKLHPMFDNSTYDPDHDLPIVTLYLTYGEPVDPTLVEAMQTFAAKLADGREFVRFSILSGGGNGRANIEIYPETGEAVLYGDSAYSPMKEGDLTSILEEATKRFPLNFPYEKRSEIFPFDDDDRY